MRLVIFLLVSSIIGYYFAIAITSFALTLPFPITWFCVSTWIAFLALSAGVSPFDG